MKKNIVLSIIFLLLFNVLSSQNVTISGYISDDKSGETLISSSIYDTNSKKGAVSNTYGFYSITLPKANVELQFSYIGYAYQNRSFKLNKDTVINIKLTQSTELKEITVVGQQKQMGVNSSQMSAIEVPISMIKNIPTLFGETDVLKALQLLPGVKAGAEGFAGFYVRGGGPDENLFLLDGVPVYNVNHLGGFFSVFNADAIKNVTLYKGGFPARFGGRLSSVLDIRMNDGNNKKIHGNVTVGLISSKINLEGPLFSEKTTFNISARRTYFDILAQPAIKLIAKSSESNTNVFAGYYFYDFNAKISHKFSDNDRLYLSTYMGDDVIYANVKEGYSNYDNEKTESKMNVNWDWGNFITALRWNHIISNKLFMNTTATYTRYRFNMSIGQEYLNTTLSPPSKQFSSSTVGYLSGIQDYGAKVDFDYSPNPNHDVKFGAAYTNHAFRPGVSVAQSKFQSDTLLQVTDTVIGNKNVYSHETTMYIEDNIAINSFVKANFGLHYSSFYVQEQFYHSLQPRVSLRALINDKLSVKAGYAAMSQYIHLLSNSNISLPTDLWVPATKRVKPMNSHQYSVGVFYNLLNMLDLSVEAYYKGMNNLIEYKDGASFLGSSTGWEDKVAMGKGWAYGVELLAQKSIGKTTGWIGYTWSKAERLFDRVGQEINNGEVFPAKYDRRHDVSIVVSHKFSKKFDAAATWVYNTGSSGTLGLQNYLSNPNPEVSGGYYISVPYISQRNNFRLPDYHRLDLGVNFHKQKKHGIRTWNISVYNAYFQMNPFLIMVRESYNFNPIAGTQSVRKSLNKLTIFPFIPSVSYSYKF